MKGIILAGGLGTRLYPLTYITNKHLLPVYDQPMVFYPIQTLVKAGIRDIMVVVGGPHAGYFLSVLENGEQLGIRHLEYAYQDATEIRSQRLEGGISHALSLAEDFADGGPVTVILGDNTTDADISAHVKSFQKGALVFLKKVPAPNRYGVPVFDKEDKKQIVDIEEKPQKPKSDYAVTGLYIYDNKVFNYIRTLEPSGRGELEITDLNNIYIKNRSLRWVELDGFWTDAGTFDSLLLAGQFWSKKKRKT